MRRYPSRLNHPDLIDLSLGLKNCHQNPVRQAEPGSFLLVCGGIAPHWLGFGAEFIIEGLAY